MKVRALKSIQCGPTCLNHFPIKSGFIYNVIKEIREKKFFFFKGKKKLWLALPDGGEFGWTDAENFVEILE